MSTLGRADIVQQYGWNDSCRSSDSATFDTEVIGVQYIVTNDVEGMWFLEEDGQRHRLGQDENMSYYPPAANFYIFNGRFRGFEARYRPYFGSPTG